MDSNPTKIQKILRYIPYKLKILYFEYIQKGLRKKEIVGYEHEYYDITIGNVHKWSISMKNWNEYKWDLVFYNNRNVVHIKSVPLTYL